MECNESCKEKETVQNRVLVVHLAALGAVIRSTSLLPAIKRKYPNSHITWVTQAPAGQLLKNNHFVDCVYELSWEAILQLKGNEYDVAFSIDKSIQATSVLEFVNAKKTFGFVKDKKNHVIQPANEFAQELWDIGLSDHKKFFENKKPETQLMHEAFALGEFKREPYQLFLSEDEIKESLIRKKMWLDSETRKDGHDVVIGLNIGCSSMLPYRKLSIEGHRTLIKKILSKKLGTVVLLGGKEEYQAAIEIAKDLDVVISSMDRGLRDGLVSVEACDIIFSGDSLGMHMGIALKKWVVSWFGPTCAHEIDLYERGAKVMAQVGCSPCWKRNCEKQRMCYDHVSFDKVVEEIISGIKSCKKPSISKPPLLEISF